MTAWRIAALACATMLAASLRADAPVEASDSAKPAAVPAKPAGGWSWDELARLAGERADKAKIEFLKAAARRQKLDADLAWKDPQLRIGHTWEDSRQRSFHPNAYPRELPENGSGDTYTAALRIYISNPFVNHYVRRAGEASIQSLEARAQAEQYAVYCEVKSLCLEEERLKREHARRSEAVLLWTHVRQCLERRMKEGVVKSPLDSVKAEIARERASARADEAAQERRQIRREIAFLVGIPERELEIRYTPPEPPSTNVAFAAALADMAFARRPDLVGALAELESARANVGAAKAAHVPWFDFVEGSYSHSSGSERDWGSYKYAGMEWRDRGRKHDREDDWQIRAAITLPVFTWFGSSVKMSRLVEDAADVRVQGLRAAIKNEVECALDDFRASDVRYARISKDGIAFLKKMEARLSEFAQSAAVKPDDVCRAQIELLDYRSFKDEAEFDWVRHILMLETVSGGPLPYGAAVQTENKQEDVKR